MRSTGAVDRGVIQRSDLTGFNWANVPAILVETGFLSNAHERYLLHTSAYQQRVARGLTTGAPIASLMRSAPRRAAWSQRRIRA